MSDFSAYLKQYLKHFVVGFIIIIILGAVVIALDIRNKNIPSNFYESPNTERVYGSQRVFDYGDQLSAEEEASLEVYIREAEKKTCLDIVIVTLNRSLADYEPEYIAKYEMEITPDKYVMVFADKFWEDNRFGYDEPQVLDGTTATGDGVILVDNVFREPETQKIYTWMGTTGKAEDRYSDFLIDYALDRFYDYVETDYYRACTSWIDDVVSDMHVDVDRSIVYPPGLVGMLPLIVAGIVALIYYASNSSEHAGSVTTKTDTYLLGEPVFPVKVDRFTHKSLTKTYNPPSDSSRSGGGGGGGGHHSSGGGGSHGGGGHSR